MDFDAMERFHAVKLNQRRTDRDRYRDGSGVSTSAPPAIRRRRFLAFGVAPSTRLTVAPGLPVATPALVSRAPCRARPCRRCPRRFRRHGCPRLCHPDPSRFLARRASLFILRDMKAHGAPLLGPLADPRLPLLGSGPRFPSAILALISRAARRILNASSAGPSTRLRPHVVPQLDDPVGHRRA
jgi:hypothetical protein